MDACESQETTAADFEPVVKTKRRFGTLAVARFVGTVLKALVRLVGNRHGE